MASGAPALPVSFIDLAQRLGLSQDQWEYFAWQLICSLRVALPCTVVSFDPIKQTIVAQPTLQENLMENLVPVATTIKPLLDVPVVMPRAGGFCLTLPIQPGDECLVLFADMCIDNWWASGGVQTQDRKRRHDLSDGIAVFGPWSQPRTLKNYSGSSLQLRSDDGQTVIDIVNGVVSITAAQINLNGSVVINGNLFTPGGFSVNLQGQTSIQGKQFLTHVHKGVTAGGADSGPVGP